MFQLKVRSCGICTYFLLAELTSNLEGKEIIAIKNCCNLENDYTGKKRKIKDAFRGFKTELLSIMLSSSIHAVAKGISSFFLSAA